MSTTHISRRGFLRAATATAIASALPPIQNIGSLNADESKTNQHPNDGISFLLGEAPELVVEVPKKEDSENKPSSFVQWELIVLGRTKDANASDVKRVFDIAKDDRSGRYTFTFVEDIMSKHEKTMEDARVQRSVLEFISKKGICTPANFIKPFLESKDRYVKAAAISAISYQEEYKPDFSKIKGWIDEPLQEIVESAVGLLAKRDDIAVEVGYLQTLVDKGDRSFTQPRKKYYENIIEAAVAKSPSGAFEFLKKNFFNRKGFMELISSHFVGNQDFIGKISVLDILGMSSHPLETDSDQTESYLAQTLAKKMASHELKPKTLSLTDINDISLPLLRFISEANQRYPGYLESIGDKKMMAFSFNCAQNVIGELRKQGSRKVFKKGMRMVAALHDDASHFKVKDIRAYADIFGMSLEERDIFIGRSRSTEEYLASVSELAADRGKMSLIFNHMHGLERHIQFSDNPVTDEQRRNGTPIPHTVTEREFAKALVMGQAKRIKEDEKAGKNPSKELDLSHINFIAHGCFQYDFVLNMYDSIFEDADIQGLKVTGLPLVITTSQKGRVGYGDWYSEKDPLLLAVEKEGFEGEEMTVSQLRQVDRRYQKHVLKGLMTGQDHGDRMDLSVFSPSVVNIDERIQSVIEKMRREDDSMSGLPEPVKRKRRGRDMAFEIASKDDTSPYQAT